MKVTYYFDLISPYSWLSWNVLRRYKSRWNIELVLKPMFLGGVMKATNNRPPGMIPAKAGYMGKDLARNAKWYNIGFVPPPANFLTEVEGVKPLARSILNANRLICSALLEAENVSGDIEGNDVDALVHELSVAIHGHADLRDQTNGGTLDVNESFLKHCCNAAGIKSEVASKLMSKLADPNVKNLLKSYTEEAIDMGAFGSPTIKFDPSTKSETFDPFWVFGSDRFEQVAYLTGNSWHGPNPQSSKL
eukprot:g4082.t1